MAVVIKTWNSGSQQKARLWNGTRFIKIYILSVLLGDVQCSGAWWQHDFKNTKKITKISRTWVFQSKMVSDTPTVTVENSDSHVCQVGVTSSHVAYTKDV